MAGYDNMFGGRPSNNSMWIGNNYSAMPGYTQTPRNNYSSMNQNGMMMPSNFQQQPQSQSINNVLEVMGPESAQAFQVGPNSKVILMDASKPVFYCKQSDSSGFAATKAFQYNEIPLSELMEPQQVQSHEDNSPNPEYITKSEFNEFKKMIEELVMKDE